MNKFEILVITGDNTKSFKVFADDFETDNGFYAGYFNTTSAINALNFKMSSGNIAAGTIYLYAIDNS